MMYVNRCISRHLRNMHTIVCRYIGEMPNTYVFSKKLAEQVIGDYSESLPCVLLRPSIGAYIFTRHFITSCDFIRYQKTKEEDKAQTKGDTSNLT